MSTCEPAPQYKRCGFFSFSQLFKNEHLFSPAHDTQHRVYQLKQSDIVLMNLWWTAVTRIANPVKRNWCNACNRLALLRLNRSFMPYINIEYMLLFEGLLISCMWQITLIWWSCCKRLWIVYIAFAYISLLYLCPYYPIWPRAAHQTADFLALRCSILKYLDAAAAYYEVFPHL